MTEIVTTIKGGRDFDAPWIVLHAETIEEALGQLAALGSTDIATLAANAARSFQAQYAATGLGQTTVVPAAPAPQAAPQAAAPAATAPNTAPAAPAGAQETIGDRWQNLWTYNHPQAPACAHAVPYALKAGTSKAGKAYSGWFCVKAGPKPSALQGNACDASFDGVPR